MHEWPLIVMLIDDTKSDRFLFGDMLANIDNTIQYLEMPNADGALHYLNTNSPMPHFIFLDLRMPLMNGIECLKEIKKIEQAANIPVYMYSGVMPPDEVEQAMQLGAAGSIEKAVDYIEGINQIIQIINSAALRP
jgi:DNA-binding NarL/FixJ family response regulator